MDFELNFGEQLYGYWLVVTHRGFEDIRENGSRSSFIETKP